jgi:general secretion pathway protein M
MIQSLRMWYFALSERERLMVAAAGTLTAIVLLIFAIVLPMIAALDSAQAAHDEAVARRGRIEATVAAALEKPSKPAVAVADINLVVAQGAAEKGFDIIASTGGAPGQSTFRIDQARAPALFGWLSELEAQGIDARTITLRSGANGSLTVEAQLQGRTR